jgi:hypothetical protein
MIRKDVLTRNNLNYVESLNQDYFLWTEILKCSKARILPERIISLRRHSGSLTSRFSEIKWQLQVRHSLSLVKELLNDDLRMDSGEFGAFYSWVRKTDSVVEKKERKKFIALLMRILVTFCKKYKPFERSYFKKEYIKILRREPAISFERYRIFVKRIPFLLGNY